MKVKRKALSAKAMLHMSLGAVTALSISTTSAAYADGTVSVQLTQEGQDLADQAGFDVGEFEGSLERRLGEAFDTYRPAEYLEALSNAVAFSNRGIGVDYASGANRFEVGVAGNLSLSLGDKGLGEVEADRPVAGLAPNLSLMLGYNLKDLGLPSVTLFANGFHRKADYKEFRGSATNAGLHAQIRLFRPRDLSGLRKLVFAWGGLDITSGLEYTKLGLTLRDELDTTFEVGDSPNSVDVLVESTGTYKLSATALTVPIEVTTSVRIAYLLWLYGGIGADMQLGGADLSANLQGSMSAQDPQSGDRVDVGTARVDINEEGSPSLGRVRFLVGAQAEVLFLKVFVQANLQPDQAAGLTLGMRAAF